MYSRTQETCGTRTTSRQESSTTFQDTIHTPTINPLTEEPILTEAHRARPSWLLVVVASTSSFFVLQLSTTSARRQGCTRCRKSNITGRVV